jgi:hypothetical protein
MIALNDGCDWPADEDDTYCWECLWELVLETRKKQMTEKRFWILMGLVVTPVVTSVCALAVVLWTPRTEAATGINGVTFANIVLIWLALFALNYRIGRLAKPKAPSGTPDTIGSDRS